MTLVINNLRTYATEPNATAHGDTERRDDELEGSAEALLTRDQLAELSRVSGARSALHVAFEWGLIVASIWLCERYWSPWLYLLTVACIGGRQHALGLLMHEAAHFRFMKNRRVSDWVADLCVAWPVLVSTRAYRVNHFAHHRHVNTAPDPDLMRKQSSAWQFPMSKLRAIGILLRDLSGLNTHEQFGFFSRMAGARRAPQRAEGPSAGPRYRLAQLGFYLALAGLFTAFHLWTVVLLYWVVPLFTWLKAILRIRSVAEHFATENDHPLTISRTTRINVLEKFFIAPKNINYHVEHHLFPSVPFYRLPRVHRLLMQNEAYRARAHVTRSYLGVLAECSAK